MTDLPIAYSIQIANTETGDYDAKLPLPKPFHTAEDGTITRHISMEGGQVVGFSETPEPGPMGLTWSGFQRDPEAAVGMYLITADRLGHFASWGHPITRVTDLTPKES